MQKNCYTRFRPNLMQMIEHYIRILCNKIYQNINRNKLNNIDFTIISNNCWGGVVYEKYNIQKKSPTVGTFIFPDDYLKLIKNIKTYLDYDLEFITLFESKHKKELITLGCENKIIGRIKDVEIVFYHYNDKMDALNKWRRRIKRINYGNMIFKFSEMNGCTKQMLYEFDRMDLNGKKILFTVNDDKNLKSSVQYKGFEKTGQILNDTYFFDKYFNLNIFINEGNIVKY